MPPEPPTVGGAGQSERAESLGPATAPAAANEVASRELAVDLYRVAAVALVVAGHWLAASVAFRGGQFVRENALAEIPWTQWLTWIFQVVPVFFLVAGYAGAASWTRRTTPYSDWLRWRVRTVLGPTAAYVAVVLVAVGMAVFARVDASAVALTGWTLAMHLWFIPVYLAVVAITPAAIAMHRRWGLPAALVLGTAMVAVDVVSLSADMPDLREINNVLCWMTMFQFGVAWYFGSFRGCRALWLTAVACATLVVAIGVGPYPVSLIEVPGDAVHNSTPPSIVMLAVGLAQAGVLITIAPAVTRRLRVPVIERALSAVNHRVMLVYLWHMTAVIVLAVVAYPAGWFPQPPLGTGAWWLSRALWIATLSALMAVLLLLIRFGRGVLAAALPSIPIRVPVNWDAPLLLSGTAIAAVVLWVFSLSGFAPHGGFPTGMALLFWLGVALAAARPSRKEDHRGPSEDFGP